MVEVNFPFETVRKQQKEFIDDFSTALENNQNFISHAPTGIGKTAAVLAPAITYAKKHKKTIFFLTSRHTQHKIALETLQKIKEKYGLKLTVTDIIGRQWMCSQPNVHTLYSGEFYEYCRSVRENDKCEYYQNTKQKNKLTTEAKAAISSLSDGIYNIKELTTQCYTKKLCPYEIALALASRSDVVITDYYYLFHPKISELFLKKTALEIEESIIIVDEAHNLPPRLMEIATDRLSSININRAIKEAKKSGYPKFIETLQRLQDILNNETASLPEHNERIVGKQAFIKKINQYCETKELIEDLEDAADEIREKQRQSYLGGIGNFLSNWLQYPEEGFARIITKTKDNIILSNNCLDPSVISRETTQKAVSTVLMSGTLNPPSMYKDILGLGESIMKNYSSPFPENNKLNLIIPKTSTKYDKRSESMYKLISIECAKVANNVPGNTIIFFPSYILRDKIAVYFEKISEKTSIYEQPNMNSSQRNEMLEKFKSYNKSGAVLLSVIGGSFYEGVDLPGDLLKCVVIVGLPFQQPDLKTKELISYYDKKYGKGWDYGYVFPAFNKTLQSAGRCIRSENDRGIVVFLDERYAWNNYKKVFPTDTHIQTVQEPVRIINSFFGDNS